MAIDMINFLVSIGCKCRAVPSPSVSGAVTTTSDGIAANAVTFMTAKDS